MINVTQTFLPPIEEYQKFVQRAFDRKWLTNRGELVLELEGKLRSFLSVQNIIITNNGTVPLQIALKLLAKGGEVITTPFSYVATTASIMWENCKPVFVDIHPEYLTIDENKIEEAITEKTTVILATHVFGNPCNIEAIEKIAKKYNLKVVYDAAHCFGVDYKGKSIFTYGDVSSCSFHATKLFHTAEGGAIFCNDNELNHKLYYSHNFGHNGPLDFFGLGINGKISELQAAMGLAVYPYVKNIIEKRKQLVEYYNYKLSEDVVSKIKIRESTNWNYSYYPILFKTESQLLQVLEMLSKIAIIPRRYFYPSLNTLHYLEVKQQCLISESVSSRILCLPLFYDLDIKVIDKVAAVINSLPN